VWHQDRDDSDLEPTLADGGSESATRTIPFRILNAPATRDDDTNTSFLFVGEESLLFVFVLDILFWSMNNDRGVYWHHGS
jgi:hypothetical protein